MSTAHLEKFHNWRDRGRCVDQGDVFFAPDMIRSLPGRANERSPKAICRGCPVAWPCLKWALDRDERDGIYGGLTYSERQKLAANPAAMAIVMEGAAA